MLFGRSGSGKTVESVRLVAKYKMMTPEPIVVLISPTAMTDPVWLQAGNEFREHTGRHMVDKHFESMDDTVATIVSNIVNNKATEETPYLVMFDDAGADHRLNRTYINNPFRKISIHGNHNHITLIINYQNVSMCLNALMHNADIVVAKKLLNEEFKLFYKQYMQDVSLEKFMSIAGQCWDGRYDALVIKRYDMEVEVYQNWVNRIF